MVTCRLPSLIKGHFSCHLTIGGLRSTAETVTSSLRVCSLELKGTLVEDSKSYEGWSRHPDIILYLLVSIYVFKLFVHPVFLPHPPCQTKKNYVFKNFHGIHLSKIVDQLFMLGPWPPPQPSTLPQSTFMKVVFPAPEGPMMASES